MWSTLLDLFFLYALTQPDPEEEVEQKKVDDRDFDDDDR